MCYRLRSHDRRFQSVCDRLRGFGLAAEVLRNVSRMAPADYCYRPTRRGLKLLKLLGAFGGWNTATKPVTAPESREEHPSARPSSCLPLALIE